MFRANMDEMNVEAVDHGGELREGVQPRLTLTPVIVRSPVTSERLYRRQPYALRSIVHRFPVRPPRGVDAPAQIGKLGFRNTHVKRPDRASFSCCSIGLCHVVLPFSALGVRT